MPKYKLIIAYDGSAYHGWQAQPDRPTIAGTLETTFTQIFASPIHLVGVSRTDAGVHALGQVASAKIPRDIPAEKLMFAWNNKLPSSIHISSCERMADDYTPFADITNKIYRYQFCTQRPLPSLAPYCWHVHYTVNLDLLNQALQIFVGTHDFRSFSTGDDRGDDTIRTIHEITITYDATTGCYQIFIKGPTFLRYMVRRIVGAALDIASRKRFSVDFLQKALESRSPYQPFMTAPAQGLTLQEVVYKNTY